MIYSVLEEAQNLPCFSFLKVYLSMNLWDLEGLLPHWFGNSEMQYIQWIYALWQIARCNPVALLALSYLPFWVSQKYKKKTVVVLGETADYQIPYNQREAFLRDNAHRLKNLEILWHRRQEWCYMVKYCGHYYITNENSLCQLAKCAETHGDITENIIFVHSLLTVSCSLAVGKKISHREAYEKVFTKRYRLSRGADFVVPTCFDYVDLSSMFWGVLSSLPILLQARNYIRLSNLLGFVIILLDFNRYMLYKFYDRIFQKFVDYVKLNVFKERGGLYDFFSIFSKRWRYSDTVKKHAYVANRGEKVKLRAYCKLQAEDDLIVDKWAFYYDDPNDQHICMEVVQGRAHCSLMLYDNPYADAILNKSVYVP